MTNFFLEELRKIYGDGRVIHDPQFVGECCYGSLGDLRVAVHKRHHCKSVPIPDGFDSESYKR